MTATTVVSEAGAFPVPACPSWCTRPDGHELGSLVATDFDGAVTRVHAVTMPSSDAVEVCATELVGRGALDGHGVAGVLLESGLDSRELSAVEVRRLAAGLSEAADLLEQLQAQEVVR